MDSQEWCTIESDPGVFTALIKGIGVKNCQVEEIYSLDDEQMIQQLGEIFGLVFLFKWQKQEPRECLQYYDTNLFFCNQVIQNACATQALLAILLNNSNIELGSELQEFKDFTKDFDSQTRGQALSNSPLIKEVHNSFQRPEPFGYYQTDDDNKKGGDAYHFISYVPFKGKVYELDGLQSGPILIGTIQEGQSWVDIAKQEINQRIQKYNAEEVMFNLMALIKDKKQFAEQTIIEYESKKLAIYDFMTNNSVQLSEEQIGEQSSLKSRIKEQELNKQKELLGELLQQDKCEGEINECNLHIQEQNSIIQEENNKAEKHRLENIRRKHNYIPFILELLKMTAKKGKLQDLVKNAKEKQAQRDAQKQKNKSQQQQQQQ